MFGEAPEYSLARVSRLLFPLISAPLALFWAGCPAPTQSAAASPGATPEETPGEPEQEAVPDAPKDCAVSGGAVTESQIAADVPSGGEPFSLWVLSLDDWCQLKVALVFDHGKVVEVKQGGIASSRRFGGDDDREGPLVARGTVGSRIALMGFGRCLKSEGAGCVSYELVVLDATTKRFVVVGRTGPARDATGPSIRVEDGEMSLTVAIPPGARIPLESETINLGKIEAPVTKW